jgi:hypothetical protein
MLPPIERVRVDGPTGRALERYYTLLTALRELPLLDGALLENVTLVHPGTNVVPHGLARRPLGYIVVSRSAAATVHELKASRTERTLSLLASANVTVDLWVF